MRRRDSPEFRAARENDEMWSELRSVAVVIAGSGLPAHRQHEAEDMAQEAMIRLFRALGNEGTFRGESSVSTYLHAIVRNLKSDAGRAYNRRAEHESMLPDDNSLPCQLSPEEQVVAEMALADEIKLLVKGVRNPEELTIILYGRASGEPYQQIADHITGRRRYHNVAKGLGAAAATVVTVGALKAAVSRAVHRHQETEKLDT